MHLEWIIKINGEGIDVQMQNSKGSISEHVANP